MIGLCVRCARRPATLEVPASNGSKDGICAACEPWEMTPYTAESFDTLVRLVCPVGGNSDDAGLQLGNVNFWIDASGPWKGQLSHSISTSLWDIRHVSADLTAALTAYAAARDMARKGYAGLPGEPLPLLMDSASVDWINGHVAEFRAFVALHKETI